MSCRFGPIDDPERYRFIEDQGLFKAEVECELGPTALKVLSLFVASPNIKKSAGKIAEGFNDENPENFAREYVRQIRAVLGQDAIRNVRGLGYRFTWKVLDDGPPSIAVLPFTARGREFEDEYFADGLTDDITDILMKSPELTVVVAQRLAYEAQDAKNGDYRTIGERLGVGFLVEGNIERDGSQLRVFARLINVRQGGEVWRGKYDKQVTAKFAVRDEIAIAIARALHVKLTKGQKVVPEYVPNPDAHEAFWKGRHQFYRYSKAPSALAAEHFEQAIRLDPQWAAPRSALAYELFMSGILGWREHANAKLAARAEAERALRLHDSDPIAHMVLGAIAGLQDYDWKLAERHFSLALASESVPPEVRVGYAQYFLMPLGRFDEAVKQCQAAIKKDPLNALWRTRLAGALLCAEMYDRAMGEARDALVYDSKNYSAHYLVAMSYAFQGKVLDARESAEEAVNLGSSHDGTLGLLAGILAKIGDKQRAAEIYSGLRTDYYEGRIMYHLICSEIDDVLKWYERNIELRYPGAAILAAAGFHRATRANPRWPRLASMMNLPQSQ